MLVRKPVELIQIHLNGSLGSSITYPLRPNTTFKGQVKIQLSAPIENPRLSITLKAVERFHSSDKPNSGPLKENCIFNCLLKLWSPDIAKDYLEQQRKKGDDGNYSEDDQGTLGAGLHVFYFTGVMPNINYPASIKGPFCEHQYMISAELSCMPSRLQAELLASSIVGSTRGLGFGQSDDVIASCEKELVYIPLIVPPLLDSGINGVDEILYFEKRGNKSKPAVHLYAVVQGCNAWPGSSITIHYGAKSLTSSTISKVTATLFERTSYRKNCQATFEHPVWEADRKLCEASDSPTNNSGNAATSSASSRSRNNSVDASGSLSISNDLGAEHQDGGGGDSGICDGEDGIDLRTFALNVQMMSVGSVGSDYINFSHFLRLTISTKSWLGGESAVSTEVPVVMYTIPPQLTTPISDMPDFNDADVASMDSKKGGQQQQPPSSNSFCAEKDRNASDPLFSDDQILRAVEKMQRQQMAAAAEAGLVAGSPGGETAVAGRGVTTMTWEVFFAQNENIYPEDLTPPLYCDMGASERYGPTLTRINLVDHPPIPLPKEPPSKGGDGQHYRRPSLSTAVVADALRVGGSSPRRSSDAAKSPRRTSYMVAEQYDTGTARPSTSRSSSSRSRHRKMVSPSRHERSHRQHHATMSPKVHHSHHRCHHSPRSPHHPHFSSQQGVDSDCASCSEDDDEPARASLATTPMYARPSFQAESCNSSVRSSTSTADPTASVSRSKSERDSDYHRSHRHYDKYHRPTTSRSNHQRPSPRHERHRQLKSTSGRKSSESTAEPFKLSKPLPGLPLPLDIITDPRLLKKKGKPASAGRRSGKRNTPSPRKDLTNITGITAQATGAEAASADAKSESDANSDTSAESKTLMSATSLTRVTPTIVTLDTIPQSPASSDGRASPSMRRKAERASALYKLTANQGVQGKRAKNELYRNKSMDRLHVESADLARRLDKEIRCRINMDKFRGCKVSRVSIIPFPASPPLSPLSMAAGNRSWRRRKTDASSGKVRIQSTRSIADMRIATSLITPSSSDSTFANSVFSEDNDSLSPGVGLSPTTATTTVATAPTNLSEPTTVTTTIANGDNSWDRDDDDDDDCGALAFQEGQQRQRIKASIRDSLILPLSIQMSRYSKQQLRKRLTIKRVTREFPEGIMVDPSLVLCMPSAVDLRAFIMGEDDNGALSKAIMASETRAAVIAISGYQPIDEQDELPPYSPPATQPELLAADKAKSVPSSPSPVEVHTHHHYHHHHHYYHHHRRHKQAPSSGEEADCRLREQAAVDDGASAAQQQELGPGDPKELASVTTTEASLSGSNHRRRGRGSGRRRRNGDSDVGNLEKVKDLVSPTTTDTSDAKHQYRHRKGGSSCHHQHRETAADSLYAASTNRSHTSSSSGRQHLCHSIVSTTSNGSKLSHDGSSKSKPKPQAFEPVSKELRKSMHKQLPSIPPPSPSQPSPPPIGTKSSSSAKEHTQLSPTLKNATATCSSSSCPSEASLLPKRAASHGANDARHKVRTKGLVSPPASNAISDASVIGRPASSRSAASSDRGEVKPSKFSLLSSLTGKLKLWAP